MWPIIIRIGGAAIAGMACNSLKDVLIVGLGLIVYGMGVMLDYKGE